MCDTIVPRVPHSNSPSWFESSRHLGGVTNSDPNMSDVALSVQPSHISILLLQKSHSILKNRSHSMEV